MAKVFDVTLNTLIDAHVEDWAAFLSTRAGLPSGPVSVLDTDLSTTLQADRLFRIDGPVPFALHLELISSGRLGLSEVLLRYNVAAFGIAKMPIHSVIVLLRPQANATDLNGILELPGADGHPYLTFRYTVIKVWLESVANLLAAGPGLAPLAILTNEAMADPDTAFERFRDRLREPDVPDKVEEVLLGSTFILAGLRYDQNQIVNLYRRLSMIMEDSTTYQWILGLGIEKGEAKGVAIGEAKGETQEARKLVLLLGTKRFGAPPPAIDAELRATNDRERLERIAGRTLDAVDWEDLIATP